MYFKKIKYAEKPFILYNNTLKSAYVLKLKYMKYKSHYETDNGII